MEILNYRDVIGHATIIGEFDVYIPEYKQTICNFKVARTSKGKIFINGPRYMKEIAGVKKFYPYFTFDVDFEEKMNAELHRQIKPYIKQPTGEPPF